jgi:DHA1 family tetracycline resistance protein-like MFS transporter
MFARLLPILGITFIDVLGFSILIPILPYYVRHFGASDVAVGVLFAAFAFCQFVAGPVWGNVSDRIGRKSVLMISQVGATIGWVGLAFAPTIGWVFVARVVEGISGGNISVTQAYVADRVAPEQRSRAFAFVGAAFSSGFVLGPLAGGIVLDRYGYRAPFLLAAALQLITLVVTFFLLPSDVAAKGEKTAAPRLTDIPRYFADAAIAPVLVQRLAYALGLYAWFAVFALVIGRVAHLGPSQISYFFAAWGAMSIVFQIFVVGRLVDRMGVRAASNLGFVAGLAYFLIVPFAHAPLALLATQVLFAFALSVSGATIATLLTDVATDASRGTVLGIGSALESIAGFTMPVLSTAVLASSGPPYAGAISAVFLAIALTLGIGAQRRRAPTPLP